MNLNTYRPDNTEGYTAEQLAAMNAELETRIAAAGVDLDDYDALGAIVQQFETEVAQR